MRLPLLLSLLPPPLLLLLLAVCFGFCWKHAGRDKVGCIRSRGRSRGARHHLLNAGVVERHVCT